MPQWRGQSHLGDGPGFFLFPCILDLSLAGWVMAGKSGGAWSRRFDTNPKAQDFCGGRNEREGQGADKASTVAMAELFGLVHDGPVHGGPTRRLAMAAPSL